MKKKISILFLLRLLKLSISIINLSLAARYFGVSVDRDNWILALNCLLVIDLIIWGPINETFRAKFVTLREQINEASLFLQVKSLLLVTVLVSAAMVCLLLLFPGAIAFVVAPESGEAQAEALIFMIKVIAPTLLLNQLTLIGASILNAYESFFLPEISGLISAVVNLLFVIVLSPYIGIYSLAFSYYFGLLLLLVLLILQLRKRNIPIFSGYRRIPLTAFYPFLRYAIPFFVPYFFIQLNLLLEKSLASLLGTGMVSSLDYARKFIDIPINVLTSVLLTMMVPVLSSSFAKRDISGFLASFQQVFRFGILIVTLLIAFISSSSQQLVSLLLYHKGQIDQPAITLISNLSHYYSWTALINFFYIMYGLALLSASRGRIYAFFGVVAQLIMIGINLAFYDQLALFTFPVSFIIAHTCAAIGLFIYFPGSRLAMVPVTFKYLSMLLLLIGGTLIFTKAVPEKIIAGLSNYGVISVNSVIIVLLFLAILYMFRLEERLFINRFVTRLIGRKSSEA